MLRMEIQDILTASKGIGWVLEPESKRLLVLSGLEAPRFLWATRLEDALHFAGEIGYPVVAKVVSPKVLHKSNKGGVVVGIYDDNALQAAYEKLCLIEGFSGILVEEMVSGLELITGAKMDYQFGPVILLGMGGTGVEIYQDSVIRMAPLREKDVLSMVKALKAHALIEGYRGSDPVNLEELIRTLLCFSALVMELEGLIESIDVNPLKCTKERCMVADARIMLSS